MSKRKTLREMFCKSMVSDEINSRYPDLCEYITVPAVFTKLPFSRFAFTLGRLGAMSLKEFGGAVEDVLTMVVDTRS